MKTKLKLCDGCGEHKHIFKNVTEDGERKRLCAWCAKIYDANRKSKHKPTTARKPIAPRSPKRQKQEREYNKRARIFKDNNPHCQIGIPGKCTHKTNDVHHEGGKENHLLLKEEWWRAACRACHDWVTVNTEAAIDLGYSRQRTTNSDKDGKTNE